MVANLARLGPAEATRIKGTADVKRSYPRIDETYSEHDTEHIAGAAVLGTIDMASSDLVEALDALEAVLIDASKADPSTREASFSNAVIDAERRLLKAMKNRLMMRCPTRASSPHPLHGFLTVVRFGAAAAARPPPDRCSVAPSSRPARLRGRPGRSDLMCSRGHWYFIPLL